MTNPIRKEVRRLKGYRLERQYERIKLNQNESPYDLPEPLKKKALKRMESADWNRYPTPFCDPLRLKIAEREGLTADHVLISGGSNILIQAITIASAVKSKILTVTPSFSLYEIEGGLLGNRVALVPLRKSDFSLPADAFLKALKKVRPNIVFFANPNAPTGNLFPEDDMVEILKASRRVGALVVIDEAYYPFSRFTMAPHLKEFSNLVIVRTLSKAFSLGGVRLGYLLADPAVVGELIKVILPFSVGVLSQIVGEVVLEDDDYVRGVVDEMIAEREFLYQALKEMDRLKVYPSCANYVLFQTPKAEAIFQKLSDQEILVRNVSGHGLPNALRVSVGKPSENRAFIEAMVKIVGS